MACGKTKVKSVSSGDYCSLHWFCHLKNGGKHRTKPPGEWWGLNETVLRVGPTPGWGRNVVSLIYCSHNCWGGWYLLVHAHKASLTGLKSHWSLPHPRILPNPLTLEHRGLSFSLNRGLLGSFSWALYAVRLFETITFVLIGKKFWLVKTI